MAITPKSEPENPIDFRAPPPSPVAAGRRSSVTNDDVLTDFLEHSLRVPDLILPDRVFPRQKSIQNLPKLDLQSLESAGDDDSLALTLDSIAQIGCFELVSHGIPRSLIRSVLSSGAGVFRLPAEKKAAVSRSPDRLYGFEEGHGEDGREGVDEDEEFVWCSDEAFKLEMEGIWPTGYSNFSEKMERLFSEAQKVAEQVLKVLQKNIRRKLTYQSAIIQEEEPSSGSICYLHRHCPKITKSYDHQLARSLEYNAIRMLIRGSECSHALSLHVFNDSSEFHVYSKKGWVSFCPDQDALVVTIGDQLQAMSGGQYKHVIGRPVIKGEEDEDIISLAFLYCPPVTCNTFKSSKQKTFSLGQQAIMAILLTLAYHLLFYVYDNL